MTGSFFRGDSVPVLLAEEEAKFTNVIYNYYQQLNGYQYLKTLGIGYHFYQRSYLTALHEVLDTDKKTILHIPNVNAGESTKDKYKEVDSILDIIGTVEFQDEAIGLLHVKRKGDGKIIKVADLVNDTPKDRDKVAAYLKLEINRSHVPTWECLYRRSSVVYYKTGRWSVYGDIPTQSDGNDKLLMIQHLEHLILS